MDEFELLRGINSRNKRAVQTFHELVFRKLYWFALTFVNDTADAQSIVNDVFLKFLKSEKIFDSVSHAEKYLYNGVRWASSDALKRDKRNVKGIAIYDLSDVISDEESIDDKIVKAEVYAAILQLIEELSASDQTMLKLYFFENKKSAEIAQVMNMRVQSVHNKRNKLIQAIKVELVRKKLIIFVLYFFLQR
jgi:RNA polymerase sigma-70 factor (ECF subfamily)